MANIDSKPAAVDLSSVEIRDVSKSGMALDALSKLTRQFADNPDFRHLIEILMLTLSGQFAVPGSFITVRNPASDGGPPIGFATGRFKNDPAIQSLSQAAVFDDFFEHHHRPLQIGDKGSATGLPGSIAKFGDCGVQLLSPLVHSHRLIGVLGLGSKASGKPFEDSEIELLQTVINTVTPLLANSFLFMEISNLNTWYREILDNVKQGVFVFDSNFMLKKVNNVGLDILCDLSDGPVSGAALNGAPLSEVFCDGVFPGWSRRLAGVRRDRQGTLLENLSAGVGTKETNYNVLVSSIRRESGIKSDIIVALDDVTERKANEQRLFDLQSFAEKGVMASSIAHELNNFLGLVLGGVELTDMALSRNMTEKAQSSIERLKDSVNQMKRFTAGLMDYGKLDTKKAPADLNAIADGVLAFVTAQKQFKGVRIATDFDAQLTAFEMDRDQMAQLLMNLLNNAADAIAEAGPASGQIVVKTTCSDESVCLLVADNGIGMTEEVRGRLFKSRFTSKKNGHGYGLVTCARIVENHQATVEIESTEGKGTTFRLHFPIKPA